MRTRLTIQTAALLLASAGVALAQSDQPLPSSPLGWVTIGFRVSDVSGDRARFERYSDIRESGYNLDFGATERTDERIVDFGARNVGYNDQRYTFAYHDRGKLKISFLYDQIPLNYGYKKDGYVETPYEGFNLDDATQKAVEARQAIGWRGSPVVGPSAYASQYRPIDLTSRRSTVEAGVAYAATPNVDLTLGFNGYRRDGAQPWGASFGFSQALEVALPLDNRTTAFNAGLEWGSQHGALRVGFETQEFLNDYEVLVWDSPGKFNDSTNPTAYVLGDGTSKGRMALAPDNRQGTFTATGVYRLPRRSTLSGTFAYSRQTQDGTIIPFTINTSIPAIHQTRETAAARADLTSFGLQYHARPVDKIWITARYRYSDRTNKTPVFDGEEYVRFDQVLEETGGETEQFNITHSTVNLGVAYSVVPQATLRFDYGYDAADRTHREFETTKDNTVRVSLDSAGSAYFSTRFTYERSQRRGEGFDPHLLEEVGAQPTARHYDVAERARDRYGVIFSLTPTPLVGVSVTALAGKDEYNEDAQKFGLLNNENNVFSVGIDLTPTDTAALGASYGWERYTAMMRSRNANPAPDPSWTDPNRDWQLDDEETVNTFSIYADFARAIPKVDLRVGYDYSKSDMGFVYSGARVNVLSATPAPPTTVGGFTTQFGQLPNVLNTWHRGTVDFRVFLTDQVALNLTYWYDKYDVEDFASPPRVDPQGGLYLGYWFRPFTANTAFVRLYYLF